MIASTGAITPLEFFNRGHPNTRDVDDTGAIAQAIRVLQHWSLNTRDVADRGDH